MINRRMFSFVAVLAAVALFAGAFSAIAADATATGTWKWTSPGRGNNPQPRESTLTLKQDGEKLTGTLKSGGANAQETEITEGSVKGADIAFKVVRKGNNGDITISYTGKLDGDTITGKIAFGTGDPRDWKATRAK